MKPYIVVAHFPMTTVFVSPTFVPTESPMSCTALSYSACEMTPLLRRRRRVVSSIVVPCAAAGAGGGGGGTYAGAA